MLELSYQSQILQENFGLGKYPKLWVSSYFSPIQIIGYFRSG